ncbi:hypothetical protein Tco_0584153 [Tanacetum coccineum]
MLSNRLRIEYPFQEDTPEEPMADTSNYGSIAQAPTEENKQFLSDHDKEDRMLITDTSTRSPPQEGPNSSNLLRLSIAFYHSLAREHPNMASKKNPLESIQTWDDRYPIQQPLIPPSKTTNLRNEITKISQSCSPDVAELKDNVRAMLLDKKNQAYLRPLQLLHMSKH